MPDLPRQAWIVLGGDTLSAVGSGMTLPFFVVYLHRVRGIELGVAEFALAMFAFANLAGNPTGGLLTDRAGSRWTVGAGSVVAAAGTASIAFVSEPWEAFAVAAATGFGAAVFWPAFDSLLAVTVSLVSGLLPILRHHHRQSGDCTTQLAVFYNFGSSGYSVGSRVEVEASTVKVDGRLEVLPVAEAVRHFPDGLDRGVEALSDSVRDAVGEEGHDVVQVALDQTRGLATHGEAG